MQQQLSQQKLRLHKPEEKCCANVIRTAIHSSVNQLWRLESTQRDKLGALIDELPEKIDLSSLLIWAEGHPPNSSQLLREVLLLIEPNELLRLGGVDMVRWTLLGGRSESPLAYRDAWSTVATQIGLNTEQLRAVKDIPRQVWGGNTDSTQLNLRNYDLISSLRSYGPVTALKRGISQYAGDQVKSLSGFTLFGNCLTRGAIGRAHEFGHVSHAIKQGDTFSSFYLDAPVSLVLERDGVQQCMAAGCFDRTDRFVVNQLQGIPLLRLLSESKQGELEVEVVEKDRWSLNGIRWREFLVGEFGKLARAHGALKLGIQSAQKNRWVHEKREDGLPHLALDRAKRIYDQTAVKLGMSLGEDGIFSLKL